MARKGTRAARFGWLVLMLAPAVACGPAAGAEVSDEDVQQAIDRGVEYLFSQQRANGWFSDQGYFAFQQNPTEDQKTIGGIEAMAMLGLTFAPVSLKDERMLKGFDALLKMELKDTYAIAPRAMVISRLLRKLDRERRELALAVLRKDVEWLQGAQNGIGAWGYDFNARLHDTYGWDFSNTQMAVLGLGEAEMAGMELKQEPLVKVLKLYLDRQRADGGWNYGMRGGFQDAQHPDGAAVGSYGSMTAAAVATLFICRDILYRGVGCPCKNEQSGKHPAKIDDAIDRGLDWLGKHFTAKQNPLGSKHNWKLYWLYSCERVGLAAGIKYFGAHDWYREGAKEAIGDQRRDGSWGGVPNAAYAICFLAKGRAPILFNKLQFKGEWNNHPRDVANLAAYVANQKEQPINWQVINMDAPVREWHDAPILYISAETPIELGDEHKKKLREFTDTGGTIFFESSCGNRSISAWWRRLVQELWPEWELRRLDKDHPLYSSDQKMLKLPLLYGMDDGVRTIMFFSMGDVSCPWNTTAVAARKELFDLGSNLYMYTTDRRALRARLAGRRKATNKAYAGAALSAGPRKLLTLARVRHGGDWYVGKNYNGPGLVAAALSGKDDAAAEMEKLREEVGLPAEQAAPRSGGLTLRTAEAVEGKDLKAEAVQVAYLSGRTGLMLGEADAAGIRKYLASGGFLLVEAGLGDRRFDAAFRAAAGQLGVELRPLEKSHGVVTGQMEGANGYALEAVKFRHALRLERVGRPVPELHGLYMGDRLVGVYSPFDLMYCQAGYDAWDCRGYDGEDALAILTNILLLASAG